MKKYLVWIGAAVMVVALASPAAAQTAWKSWGVGQIASYWISKPDFGQGGWASTGTGGATVTGATGYGYTPRTSKLGEEITVRNITERFNFYLQYGDPKTVRGVIGFEADSSNWGESGWTAQETTSASTGATTSNPSGRMGTFRTDQPQLEIKWAFIEFVVPSTPVTVTAGMQGYYVGGRLFLSDDAPGLTVSANFAPHKISAYWYRMRDVDPLTYNTDDMYGLQYQLSQKLFNVYAYGFYRNGLANTAGTLVPGTGGTTGVAPVMAEATVADHPWWIGVGGGFRPGNWDFSGQFIYNGGKRESRVAGVSDIDYTAAIVELMGAYRIGPGLKVALEAYYATGNDADDTSKIKAWTYPNGTEAVWGMGNDRSVFFMYNGDFMYWNFKYLYTTGIYYGRANVEYNPLAWLNLNFNYLYFGDTAKGTRGAGKQINSPTGAQQTKDEDYIGSELNVIAKIKIYEGLYYNLGLGYFLPGPVYDHYNTAGAKDRSPDNAWSFVTCLRYFF
jgi:hypothetical protein